MKKSQDIKLGDAGANENSTKKCSCGGTLETKGFPRDPIFPKGGVGYYVIKCLECGASRTVNA